jgi:hypothetical protein
VKVVIDVSKRGDSGMADASTKYASVSYIWIFAKYLQLHDLSITKSNNAGSSRLRLGPEKILFPVCFYIVVGASGL